MSLGPRVALYYMSLFSLTSCFSQFQFSMCDQVFGFSTVSRLGHERALSRITISLTPLGEPSGGLYTPTSDVTAAFSCRGGIAQGVPRRENIEDRFSRVDILFDVFLRIVSPLTCSR